MKYNYLFPTKISLKKNYFNSKLNTNDELDKDLITKTEYNYNSNLLLKSSIVNRNYLKYVVLPNALCSTDYLENKQNGGFFDEL